jgi:hypothetical protein
MLRTILNGIYINMVWGLDWIDVSQDIDQWWSALDTTMQFTQKPDISVADK